MQPDEGSSHGRPTERAAEDGTTDSGRATGVDKPAPEAGGAAPEVHQRRPMFERLGLAFVAIVFAALFGAIALAAWSGGEVFLAAMGGIGCAMTLWVGTLTLFRG